MNNIFIELTVVLILAGGIATLISLFKQPAILAYIITGLIIGPLGYYHISNHEVFSGLAQIGTTLLLFLIGLELDISQLKKIGKLALLAGVIQIVTTFALGLALFLFLGFAFAASALLSAGITFSSTVVVIKLLTEKKDLHSLYGKIAMAILIIQDFAAIALLVLLTAITNSAGPFSGLPTWQAMFLTLIKAGVLIWFIMWQSIHVFPKILKKIGKSDELLLVFSLAWALGLAALVSLPFIGFSIEIGGFLAGLALAKSAVHYEISAKIKSLRDFFIIIFFIILGSGLAVDHVQQAIIPGIIIAVFVIVIKPLLTGLALNFLGLTPRTSFFTATTSGQISEFSLILAALALKLGLLDQTATSIITIVSIISITSSSYIILHAEFLYQLFQPLISFLRLSEKQNQLEKEFSAKTLKNHVILVGAHRMGVHIIRSLQNLGLPFIIVDHNPEITQKYREQGLSAICGDIADQHIQELAGLKDSKLVISTVPDFQDNLRIIEKIKAQKLKTKVIVTALDEEDALTFYDKQADYTLLPHFMSGEHLARLLENNNLYSQLRSLKTRHLQSLKASR